MQILLRVLYVGRYAVYVADVVISRTVFRHNAFSTEITGIYFNIVHVNKYVTWSIDKK